MALPSHVLSSRAELEEVSRKKAAGVYYGDHRLLCRLLGDFLAFVDTRDLMLGPRLVLDGFWESWVTLAVARQLRPGRWCVDVGANYGYYTLLMAAACGPEGRVVACEPNPVLAETYLPQNLALNGFQDRVEICPKAVGNLHDCTVDFVLHDGDFATSSLERWSYSHASSKVQVPAITLDRLCADWPRLDLVKIDAEGAEALVWEGMQRTLRRFPHAAVVLELHLQRDPPQTVGFLHEIERAGYPLRVITYEGEVVSADAATILARPQEHWILWLVR
ncbi:methyltransferase FkbM family [Isosphaera pallida ATCC 43644]|uniref:Methyltransferase FkbM family n=1 Tax=Isosphaera pallida (strain ATCC 43644 / DSM 9630 / IS1B) TaxID=575540 RepID=E8QWU4_ISOPI|nr:FkbM family methyltransferase [Isosphaera pallida]ADV62994.1 methyltransferase FkbM family [Isosphaera pallida ATCC 43644]